MCFLWVISSNVETSYYGVSKMGVKMFYFDEEAPMHNVEIHFFETP